MKHSYSIGNIALLAAAAWLLLAACGGETYPEITYQPSDDNVISPTNGEYVSVGKTPIKIRASHQDFFSISSRATATRGTGAFEPPAVNPEKYLTTIFYVYAFRVGTGEDGNGGQRSLTTAPDLTRTAYSPTHETANDRENSSCLIDGYDYKKGAPFTFNENEEGTLDPQMADTLFYSGKYKDIGYNFFAYHIDDWEPTESNTHRSADVITYDMEIDGSRDILMGATLPLTDSLINADYSWLNNTPILRDSILQMHGGYSTTSGRATVQPRIRLKHKLVRMQFEAYPGDSVANQMTIDSISILVPYKAKMTVASRKNGGIGLLFDKTQQKELFLGEATDGLTAVTHKLRPGGYQVPSWDDNMKGTELVDRPHVVIASANGTTGCLLVPPADYYDAYVYYTYRDEAGNVTKPAGVANPARCRIAITDKKGNIRESFKEGTLYTVRMGIYGPRLIRIGASITGDSVTGWIRSDGKIDIDTEDWDVVH